MEDAAREARAKDLGDEVGAARPEGYEVVNPDPEGTVASLQALGYSVSAAVADLVDNSVSAGATAIDVLFSWSGASSWVAVVDNGLGMSEDELRVAMTVAGLRPGGRRSSADLGRFGMGLKTASFSQAAELVVASAKEGGHRHVRAWDLDLVRRTNQWRLLLSEPAEATEILDGLWDGRGHGTVALWRRLRRFEGARVDSSDEHAQKLFYAEARTVERWLGMVFERFLRGRRARRVTVNGDPVVPWDPFVADSASTRRLPLEELPVGDHVVRVQPYVLPQRGRFASEEQFLDAGGPRGWLDQQGFYVYRRDRLLVAGSWLELAGVRRDERFSLARIAVDVPAELDAQWAVDVRKSTVVPPDSLRTGLRRIAAATRRSAREALTRRGRIGARTHGSELAFAWRVEQRDGRLVARVNRSHPLVSQVLRGADESRADARALLRLLEETVPVTALRVMHDPAAVVEGEPFEGVAAEETNEVARRVMASMVEQGSSPREARLRLRQMEPFDRLQGFWHE